MRCYIYNNSNVENSNEVSTIIMSRRKRETNRFNLKK